MSRLGDPWSRTPKASVHPTMRDLAWLAGFLEGEGSFGWGKVQANQTQREPLERIQKLVGGGIGTKRLSAWSKKPAWFWQASGARGRGIMLTIYSFMSPVRRAQIRTALRSNGRRP